MAENYDTGLYEQIIRLNGVNYTPGSEEHKKASEESYRLTRGGRFEGEFEKLKNPIIINSRIPGSLQEICMTAKRFPEQKTFAFYQCHVYDLGSLKDVMELESAIRNHHRDPEMKENPEIRLKSKGHGMASREALQAVYHAFMATSNDAEIVDE